MSVETERIFVRQAEFCARHVLPFFQKDVDRGLFCVVPVVIAGRRFAWSAGHGLADALTQRRDEPWILGAPIQAPTEVDAVVRSTSIPARRGHAATLHGALDAGVVEIFPVGEEAEKLFDEAAVPLERFLLVHQQEISRATRISVTGYPGEAVATVGGLMFTPLCATGFVADGVEEASPVAPRTGRIDVAFPMDRSRNRYGELGELPRSLQGMTGGAYWLVDEADDLFFIGTHAASSDREHIIGGERYRFAHGVGIWAHLGITAMAWPALTHAILERWPEVATFSVTERSHSIG